MWRLGICQSRITGKSKIVNTYIHKYYLLRPNLNSITMTTIITTHTHKHSIRPQNLQQDVITNGPSYQPTVGYYINNVHLHASAVLSSEKELLVPIGYASGGNGTSLEAVVTEL
jgi:hypothetical protein